MTTFHSSLTTQESSTHKDTHIQRLLDPITRNPLGQQRFDAPYISRASSAEIIDVTAKSGSMVWVADQEDTFDGVEGGVSEFREGGDGCGGALGVALEDEAFGWVGGEGLLDVGYDLGMLVGNWSWRLLLGFERLRRTSVVPEAEF